MTHPRSAFQASVMLLGAFTGVAIGALGRGLVNVGDALLRRV